jgi:HD-GYP domain-containing protein (c-di-GMP phosphodiesterase class II)
MDDASVAAIHELARREIHRADGSVQPFLSEDEVENLTIRRGTLTAAEREIINHHIVMTIRMLEALPWPSHLTQVPEYAGGHHERMDGKGYPRGLTREQMSVQARAMGIADVFEALTAKDRPYKKGMGLMQSLTILGRMKVDHHVDPDLFDVFLRERVFREYAERYLDAHQIDDIDWTKVPGVSPELAAELSRDS